MQKKYSDHLEIVILEIKDYNKYYIVSDWMLFYDYRLVTLYKLFDFYKDDDHFFLISK